MNDEVTLRIGWKPLEKTWERVVVAVALLLPFICVCSVLWEIYYPSVSLSINQRQWDRFKPTEYYMRVRQCSSAGGCVACETRVRNGNVVKANTLRYDQQADLLDPTALTMEQIFDVARDDCADRGFLDCGFEFDSQFHYPRSIISYELFFLDVEQFIPCGQAIEPCPL